MAIPAYVRDSAWSFFSTSASLSFDATGVDFILIHSRNWDGVSPTSIDFDGNTMTQQLALYVGTGWNFDVWSVVVPSGSRGTHNINWSGPSGKIWFPYAVGYSGVHQTTPIGATAAAAYNEYNPFSWDITTSYADSLIAFSGCGNGSGTGSDDGSTVYHGPNNPHFATLDAATAGTYTLGFNWGTGGFGCNGYLYELRSPAAATDAGVSAFRQHRESGQKANLRRRTPKDIWKKDGLLYVPEAHPLQLKRAA